MMPASLPTLRGRLKKYLPQHVVLPAWLRSIVVRHLSTDLLTDAIGNWEGNERYFHLYREAWQIAGAVLGLDSAVDRFRSTDWRLALENELGAIAHRHLLERHYRLRADAEMAAWLDHLLTQRWIECVSTAVRLALRRRRFLGQHLAEIADQLSARSRARPAERVLDRLETLLPTGDNRAWILGVGRRDGGPSLFDPVLSALNDVGYPVLWLNVSPDFTPGDVGVTDRAWGRLVESPLPSLGEVFAREPGVADGFQAALREFRDAAWRLPRRWRGARRPVEAILPIALAKWFSASQFARVVLARVPAVAVIAGVDKDVPARAMILEARCAGIASCYVFQSLGVGTPQYWPITDRLLVTNGARFQQIVRWLGVPAHRIAPTGSLEVDRLLRQLREPRGDQGGREFRIAFLLKMPTAPAFGPPEAVLELLRDLPDAPPWTCVLRPHPKDGGDYSVLEAALPGRVRVVGRGYRDPVGMADTLAGCDVVVAGMGGAAFLAIAAGKPTVVYSPDPRLNVGQDRLFGRSDIPRHIRMVKTGGELVSLLRRAIAGQEPELLQAQPLAATLVDFMFHSLDGDTDRRIAQAIVELCRATGNESLTNPLQSLAGAE